jgi:hypothetical protein
MASIGSSSIEKEKGIQPLRISPKIEAQLKHKACVTDWHKTRFDLKMLANHFGLYKLGF